MSPQNVFLLFSLIVLAAGLFKPNATRIFTGFFFWIMALGVNLPMLLNHPEQFAQAGAAAFLPVYRWFFTSVIANHTIPLATALICFELTTGALILSRGKASRFGLAAGALFCLAVAPLGIESVTTPALALAIALLLRKNYERSVVDMLRGRGSSVLLQPGLEAENAGGTRRQR